MGAGEYISCMSLMCLTMKFAGKWVQWEHFAEVGQYEVYSGTFQSVMCLLNLSMVRVECKKFI